MTAHEVRRQLELILHLRTTGVRVARDGWDPPLLLAVASQGEGAGGLVDALDAHLTHLRSTGGFALQTGARAQHAFLSHLRDAVLSRLAATPEIAAELRAGRLDPYTAAEPLLARLESLA